jgi:hypothetical protein
MKKIKIFFIVLAVLLLGFIVFLSSKNSPKDISTNNNLNGGNIVVNTDSNNNVSGNSNQQSSVAGKYDAFATCLKDKGAVFYGAFWCSHCKNNKEMFGDSKDLLPYVECSTPDGKGQTQVCKDKNIQGYPTWRFADGSEQMGEVQLATLAEKTGCPLPQ